jgi:hypothetical protein
MFEQKFDQTSRYYGIDVTTYETAQKEKITYLKRRFIPEEKSPVVIMEHTVSEGDRIDTISASVFGDPLQFWRIADANRAMKPEALTNNPGSLVVVTQPQVQTKA